MAELPDTELTREREWARELGATLEALQTGIEMFVRDRVQDRELRSALIDLIDQATESKADALRRYEGRERNVSI